ECAELVDSAGGADRQAGKAGKGAEEGDASVDWSQQLVNQRGHAEVAKAAEEEESKSETIRCLRCQNSGGGLGRAATGVDRRVGGDRSNANDDDDQPECAGESGGGLR